MIFLNLFIAIILQGFDDTNQMLSNDYSQDSQDHFREIWMKYDLDATGFIPVDKFEEFMYKLGEPMGWPEHF
jgi:Ca2+-binding EF-hand superfamily protein